MGKYIYGKHSVIDAIINNVPISEIYINKSNSVLNNIKHNIKVVVKTKQELDALSNNANHQGIIALAENFNYYNIDSLYKDLPSKIIILDHIQDPHNLGAIIRSANAFNITYIIIPQDRAVKVNSTVLKVAAGGQINLKISKVNSLVNVVQKLKQKGYWIYSSELSDTSQDLNDVTFNNPMVIIIGNEQKGVSKSLVKLSDVLFKIPTKGTVQSLNVSVASGIILHKII